MWKVTKFHEQQDFSFGLIQICLAAGTPPKKQQQQQQQQLNLEMIKREYFKC